MIFGLNDLGIITTPPLFIIRFWFLFIRKIATPCLEELKEVLSYHFSLSYLVMGTLGNLYSIVRHI